MQSAHILCFPTPLYTQRTETRTESGTNLSSMFTAAEFPRLHLEPKGPVLINKQVNQAPVAGQSDLILEIPADTFLVWLSTRSSLFPNPGVIKGGGFNLKNALVLDTYKHICLGAQVPLSIGTDFINTAHKNIHRIKNIFLNDSCCQSSIIHLQHHYHIKYMMICAVFIMFNVILYSIYRPKSES